MNIGICVYIYIYMTNTQVKAASRKFELMGCITNSHRH